MSTALITGISGQDGSLLAELLLKKGYRVVGLVRPDSPGTYDRIAAIRHRVELVEAGMTDFDALKAIVARIRPTEIYNFAARASSSQLFSDPLLTGEYNGMAVVRLLEIIQEVEPSIRLCQASSSEMYGAVTESPQDEMTPFRPTNPYGIAKLFAHGMLGSFRETHGAFACSSILFNHESERRGHEFVTRRISRGVARIKAGLDTELRLGNLDATRDWGYAGDYVEAMWRMLQAESPDDYVLATGQSHSVREFCEVAFRRVGLEFTDHVVVDPSVKRPPEICPRVGNSEKARRSLGWSPTISFEELVCMMVDADVRELEI